MGHELITAVPDITAWLRRRVSEYLSLDPDAIRTDVPLAEYGLDSVFALSLCGDIEDDLQIEVEPTLAWDYPTLALLAEFLHAQPR